MNEIKGLITFITFMYFWKKKEKKLYPRNISLKSE